MALARANTSVTATAAATLLALAFACPVPPENSIRLDTTGFPRILAWDNAEVSTATLSPIEEMS